VVGEIFATLNVRAMLPGMRAAGREWRPDVIVREHAEFASLVAAEEAGVPHLQVGISSVATQTRIVSIAAEALDAWRAGLTDRIAETPYLMLFPASLEDPEVTGAPRVHRFRDQAADAAGAPLPDWWAGDRRLLVYVTFGSVTASEPTAAPKCGVALDAVADLPARVRISRRMAAASPRSAPASLSSRTTRAPSAARSIVLHCTMRSPPFSPTKPFRRRPGASPPRFASCLPSTRRSVCWTQRRSRHDRRPGPVSGTTEASPLALPPQLPSSCD
jgi:hypothetical protein